MRPACRSFKTPAGELQVTRQVYFSVPLKHKKKGNTGATGFKSNQMQSK
jgi:hypothetical protein